MIISGTKVVAIAVTSALGGAAIGISSYRRWTKVWSPKKASFFETVKDDVKAAWKKTRATIDPNGVVDMAELKTLVRKQREGVDIVGEALKEAADAVEDLNNP